MNDNEKDGRDISTEIVRAIVENLPLDEIYEDSFRDPSTEIGSLTTDIIKTIRLLTLPIQFAAAYQDRIAAFIKKSIGKVPKERRILPAPQILGPTLEGIKYEPEGQPIYEMFTELMARSMDKDRVAEAHPSYPLLIKQLSPDECKILKLLAQNRYELHYTSQLNPDDQRFSRKMNERDDFPANKLHFAQNLTFYMEHLSALSLSGIYEFKNQDRIDDDSGVQVGTRVFCEYRLTPFGQSFVKACLTSPTKETDTN